MIIAIDGPAGAGKEPSPSDSPPTTGCPISTPGFSTGPSGG